MSRAFVAPVFCALSVLCQPANAQQVSVACGILDADTIRMQDGVSEVSNLTPIVLQFVAVAPPQGVIEMPRTAATSDGPPNATVTVKRLGNSQAVTAQSTVALTELDGRLYHSTVLVTIPIEPAAKQQAISNYVQAAQRLAETSLPEGDPVRGLVGQTDALTASLDKLFLENEPGSYELTCTYAPTTVAIGGPVTSKSIRVNIISQGHFFDQPTLKLQ